ncbi:helix-turn-helix transcriptional regulator [Rhodococcus sp. H29-C3]|uniref:helix-turn-helix domain-containing protein n=1 Tax=Rhodococcus sp. H29-C3 TaxID=3046307 RepID=UPI0024BB8601|nr:helix-turn-helix transcriptional regulator [Rhodococcus sp. H29-C3]MDJ0362478.1 helix-turn-helix transcriptional regulator [Rhodococcus sp. H29-C3]
MGQIEQRTGVREFLKSRRERIFPDQAGLPAYGDNRRVKGLRREEVAMLAGISVAYYIRLERGNLSGTSDSVLDALARALQLGEVEREHLFTLARTAGPVRRRRDMSPPVRPAVHQVLDSITGSPALIRNGRHDVVAMNHLARVLFAPALADPRRPVNLTRFVFLHPHSSDVFVDWQSAARETATMLRRELGRNPHDEALSDLIGELSTQSEFFRQCWASHDVRVHRSGRKRLRHAAVGRLDLDYESMELASDPGLTLTVYTAPAGDPSADAVAMLAIWAETQDVTDIKI